MDTARYVMALIAWLTLPQALIYWYIVHPFIDVWRRLGKPVTFSVLAVMYVAGGYGLWLIRRPVLAVEYGTNLWLWVPGLVLYVSAMMIQIKIKKQLTFRVLAGVPELDPDGKGGELLQTGLYARVRHPRYLAVALGMVAWALFTNYLAMYVAAALVPPGLWLVAHFEERELLERFGDAYADYRRRVPTIIPRFRTD